LGDGSGILALRGGDAMCRQINLVATEVEAFLKHKSDGEHRATGTRKQAVNGREATAGSRGRSKPQPFRKKEFQPQMDTDEHR